MEDLRIDPDRPNADVIQRAAEIIAAGGVVAYPTDTLYGLAVDPRNVKAVERLFAIKGRMPDQAIPLIASDMAQVEREAGSLNEVARRLASLFWPGPLTLVIEAAPPIVPAVTARTGHVAVRVPNNLVAQALAAGCGCPVTSTSANISGEPATALPRDVRRALADRVDALLDAGPTPGGLPSTIVDVTTLHPALVRAGVVAWERVLESL